MPVIRCLILGSIFSFIFSTVLANELSLPEYRKLAKTDPQVLIELLTTPNGTPSTLSRTDTALFLSTAYYALSQAEPAINYAEQGLAEPDLLAQNPVGFHQLQLARAVAYDLAGTPAKGLVDASNAVTWAQNNQQTGVLVEALFSRGALYISLVNYLDALRDLNLAYQLAAQQPNLDTHKAEVAGMIALVYEYRREDALAIPYFTEAVAYHRAQQNWLELSVALYGLGRATKNVGDTAQGLAWLTESATIARQVDDFQGVAYAEKEIAGIELAQGNFANAIHIFQSALQLFAQANNLYMQLDINLSLAKIGVLQQDAKQAQQYLQQAEKFVDVETMPIQALEVENIRAQLYALTGEYQQAYQTLSLLQQSKRRLDNKQSAEQLHQLRVKYDVDAQQAENKLLAQKNELQELQNSAQRQQKLLLMLLLALSLALIILLFVLFIRARKNKRHLELLAETDGLTGVYNRRKIMELFQQQFELAQRNDQALSIAILDLDWFKQINDQFGHQTGDEVLWRFAALCKHQLRKSDLIGRIGGEEFIVIFPCTELTAAEQLAKRLCTKTRDLETMLAKPGLSVSVSIGLACNQQLLSGAEFIAAADKALYLAKQAGRDQVKLADYRKLSV